MLWLPPHPHHKKFEDFAMDVVWIGVGVAIIGLLWVSYRVHREILVVLVKIAMELEKDFQFPELKAVLEEAGPAKSDLAAEMKVAGAKPFPGAGHCVLCTKALEGDGVVSTVGQRLYHRGCWVKVSAEASA